MARAAARTRARGADAVERLGLADLVHEKTKELIFDRGIVPGDRIKIDQLAKRLDVSISPVREALARLLSERLVVFEPFVGYSAAPIPDNRFFVDMLELRIVLEGYAARLGAPKKSPSILRRLEQAMKGMRKSSLGRRYHLYSRFAALDAEYHEAIVASAENQLLSNVFADMRPHLHHARLLIDAPASARQSSVEGTREHEAILGAFQQGKGPAAERAIRTHLEGTRRRLLREAEG